MRFIGRSSKNGKLNKLVFLQEGEDNARSTYKKQLVRRETVVRRVEYPVVAYEGLESETILRMTLNPTIRCGHSVNKGSPNAKKNREQIGNFPLGIATDRRRKDAL